MKESRVPKPKPLIASLSASSGLSLISHLASYNASIRHETFKLIESWLSESQSQLSDDEMMRIWKGLFYCLGHSNKPSAKTQLISRVSSLLLILNPLLSLQYFSLFLVTVRRQFNGIDHLRLDVLIRKFVNGMFCLMMKCKWDLEYMGKFIYALEKNALLVEDKVRRRSVNYLIVSVFLDELKEFTVPLERKEVVKCLFRPFLGVLERSSDKVLVWKVKTCVFDVLLKMGKKLLEREMNGIEDVGGGKGERLLGIIALKMGFCAMLHEVASSIDCIQGNKEVVLELHDEFLVLEKELETWGIDIHIPEVHDWRYDVLEIPQLVPFEYGEGTKLGLTQDATEKGSLEKKKTKKGKLRDKKTDNKKTLKDKFIEHGSVAISNCPSNGNVVIDNNNLETGNSCASSVVAKEIIDTSTNILSSNELNIHANDLDFGKNVTSNLQIHFEDDSEMSLDEKELPLLGSIKKISTAENANGYDEVNGGTKSPEKTVKKVMFDMKNNLTWMTHNPLPPQNLRLPPSAIPRGSALKKGVPPGPVREVTSLPEKVVALKKGRKIAQTVSPAPKRLRRVHVT